MNWRARIGWDMAGSPAAQDTMQKVLDDLVVERPTLVTRAAEVAARLAKVDRDIAERPTLVTRAAEVAARLAKVDSDIAELREHLTGSATPSIPSRRPPKRN